MEKDRVEKFNREECGTDSGAAPVMKRFNYLLGEMEAAYHGMALKAGLSDSAMKILYAVCDNGDRCPIQHICCCSGLSKQTVNSALRKMEEEEILYLEPAGPKNKNVCLTEAGKLLAERTAGRIYRMENEILESWPQEDVQKYLELTECFLRSLQDKANRF